MKLQFLVQAGIAALLLGAAPAMADIGGGDPFEITFSPNGTATINACSGTCAFTGADNGTPVTNVGGLGGNGYDFALPQPVVSGCCIDVFNSSNVLEGVLDFVDETDLDYIVSGSLSSYTDAVSMTANADGTFTYLGPYPSTNQYNGTLPAVSGVPEPSSLTLLGVVLAGLAAATVRGKPFHRLRLLFRIGS